MSNPNVKDMTTAVCALLWRHGLKPLTEYVLPNGRRLDVAALDFDGGLLGVEVKTSMNDFNRDLKWADSAGFCFIFYVALPLGLDHGIVHPGVRTITVDEDRAWISRRTGRGLLRPDQWHEAGSRFAVKPPAGAAPLRSAPTGDASRARLWMPSGA